MLNKISDKIKLLLLLLGLFFLFFLLSFFASGTFDSGDGIRHYLVSRYSFKHPDLFLYSWGKPFFTLLSSPFSQFGLLGVNVFNIFCALLSSFLCFKIAKLLKLEYPFLVILFLCFTPIYFPTINSGLTEPFFGLILISSIYLMFRNNYFWATLLVSFLPFVRTEGNLILPFFFIILLYRKKFLFAPMLAFGTIAYSIVGYFYFKDIFWIKHQNPYTGSNYNIYGQGDLFHFVNTHDFIWGPGLGILFLLGCVAAIFLLFSNVKKRNAEEQNNLFLFEELFLIYGSFFVYFIAHSVFWWKGLAGSLGLIRVLAGVMPCSALICLRGFNLIMLPFFQRNKFIEFGIIFVWLFFILSNPFKQEYFPYKLDSEQVLVKEAGDWFKQSPFTKQKVYYLYPYLAHVLNVDSFDPNKVGELWGLYPSIKQWGIGVIPDSSIVFWDGHFGPNECAIPLDSILNDPHFELIKTFKPKEEFTTLGGYKFEVYVFMKTNKPEKIEEISSDLFDLEQENLALDNIAPIISEKAFSGSRACKLSKKAEYSVTVKKKLSEIPQNTKRINFSIKISDPLNNTKDALAVLIIDDLSGKNLFWAGKSIVLDSENVNKEWKNFETQYKVNIGSYPSSSTIKIYVWNKSKKEFYIDDLKISFWGKK